MKTDKSFADKIKSILSYVVKWPQYYVPVTALIVWFVIWLICNILHIYSFPVGYWQKIFFGILGASIITWSSYTMFSAWQPHLKSHIDTNPPSKEVTEWERTKLAFYYFALFVWSATELAKGL
jgi:hypothetical protein